MIFHKNADSTDIFLAVDKAHTADVEKGCDELNPKRTRIATLRKGQTVEISGIIESYLFNPIKKQFEVVLFDGSGYLTLVWDNKKIINGFDAEKILNVKGKVKIENKEPAMYNPKYRWLGVVERNVRAWR